MPSLEIKDLIRKSLVILEQRGQMLRLVEGTYQYE